MQISTGSRQGPANCKVKALNADFNIPYTTSREFEELQKITRLLSKYTVRPFDECIA